MILRTTEDIERNPDEVEQFKQFLESLGIHTFYRDFSSGKVLAINCDHPIIDHLTRNEQGLLILKV